jgi:hypothetical protein
MSFSAAVTFTAKYEILESVTHGRVETFIARNVASDERVLAHVFDCPEQKPHQPTVQWVLESFQAIAPEPVALVIDTGKYAGTSYAYLVTKLPSADRLRDWVQSYESLVAEESVASPLPSFTPSKEVRKFEEPLANDRATLSGSDDAHGITAAFEALRLGLAPQSETKQAVQRADDRGTPVTSIRADGIAAEPRPKSDEPGEFTKEFFAELNRDKVEPAKTDSSESSASGIFRGSTSGNIPPNDVGKSAQAESGDASVSSVFESRLGSTVKPWEGTRPIASPHSTIPPKTKSPDHDLSGSDEGKTGEFTRFIRGPFNGERAESTPDVQPGPPPAKQMGEFTEVFGSAKDLSRMDASSTPDSRRGAAASSDPGSITGLLAQLESPANESKSDVSENSASPKGAPEVYVRRFSTEKDASESMSFEPRGSSDTDPFSASMSVGSATRSEGREVEPSFSLASEPAGATRVFSTPDRDPMQGKPKLPDGPSEYTRFISGGMKSPVPAKDTPVAGGPEDPKMASASLAIPMPAMPSPQISAPQQAMPQPRQSAGYPHVPTPTPIAPPPIPQRPQIGTAPPKAAAVPWTLILILNGLFVLAVLLVLYFGLKH